MGNGTKKGKRKGLLNLKGVLIDFGYTLAYLDEKNVRRYREDIVSILTKYGYNKTLDDLVPVLDSTYRSTTKGEVKDIYEFWKVILRNLGTQEKPTLIQELTELRKNSCKLVELKWSVNLVSSLKQREKQNPFQALRTGDGFC